MVRRKIRPVNVKGIETDGISGSRISAITGLRPAHCSLNSGDSIGKEVNRRDTGDYGMIIVEKTRIGTIILIAVFVAY